MKRNVLKGIGLGFAIVIISIMVMYLGLSHYYGEGFSYGTWINGIYCTGKSISEVNEELLGNHSYEGLTILDGDGKSYAILPEDVKLSFDYSESLTRFLQKQNAYLWIDNLLGENAQKELNPSVNYDQKAYEKIISKLAFMNQKDIADRRVEIIKTDIGYSLINERVHVLDKRKAEDIIKTAFFTYESEVNIEQMGCYSDLELTQEMKDTLQLWDKINEYQSCDIIYQLGEEQLPIDGSIVCNWIETDEEGKFVFNEEGNLCTDEQKVFDFIDKLSDEYDTVGGSRHFKATRGEIVTVEGGIYGNKINRKSEKEYLLQAFLDKKKEIHTPEYTQKGWKQGKEDIGDTYIEIDMTDQMMYYYVNGERKIETPVVTGNTSLRRGTPVGTNYVYNKQRDRVLRGEDYASPVKYWIPVIKAVGIHDASWRKKYGGEIYKKDGSHGCINTPLEEVTLLYDMVEIGTPVVMFY